MLHPATLDLGSVLGACAALAFVLALIWGGQALARTRFAGRLPGRAGRRLQLMESIALDGRRRLHLVRCDARYVVLQTGGTQDVLVGWLPDLPDRMP